MPVTLTPQQPHSIYFIHAGSLVSNTTVVPVRPRVRWPQQPRDQQMVMNWEESTVSKIFSRYGVSPIINSVYCQTSQQQLFSVWLGNLAL
jgi:hypothetical protein